MILQPIAERGQRIPVIIFKGKSRFIAELPSGHRRVGSVVLSHGGDQSSRSLFHGGGFDGETLAPAIGERPLLIGTHHLRMLFVEPGRDACRRDPENDRETVLCGQPDGIVHPREIKVSLARFKIGPRKLTHAHHIEPKVVHFFEILVPAGFRPLLRIIRGAEEVVLHGNRPRGEKPQGKKGSCQECRCSD